MFHVDVRRKDTVDNNALMLSVGCVDVNVCPSSGAIKIQCNKHYFFKLVNKSEVTRSNASGQYLHQPKMIKRGCPGCVRRKTGNQHKTGSV